MLKYFLFLNDIINIILGIMEKRNYASEIMQQFNFIIGIFTLKPKLSEFY